MSPISILASTVPDLRQHQQRERDALEGLLGGLLDQAQAARDAAGALASSPAGETAVAVGTCAVAGAAAATAVAAGTIATGLATGGAMVAAVAVTCAAFAVAPMLAAAAAVPAAAAAATQQGLETTHDALAPLLPSPQRTVAEGSFGLLDLLDAARGEPRNPLLLPEPLRSMISTAAPV